jgi:hypothetical protein
MKRPLTIRRLPATTGHPSAVHRPASPPIVADNTIYFYTEPELGSERTASMYNGRRPRITASAVLRNIRLELMLRDNEIARAERYVEELRLFVHEFDVPNNNRMRAAGSCFAIVNTQGQLGRGAVNGTAFGQGKYRRHPEIRVELWAEAKQYIDTSIYSLRNGRALFFISIHILHLTVNRCCCFIRQGCFG